MDRTGIRITMMYHARRYVTCVINFLTRSRVECIVKYFLARQLTGAMLQYRRYSDRSIVGFKRVHFDLERVRRVFYIVQQGSTHQMEDSLFV